MPEFNYTSAAQQVIFGTGTLAQLDQAVDGFGWRRLMVCTIPRLAAAGLVDRLRKILGRRLVAVYTQAQPHVPQEQVEAGLALAREQEVEAIIGLGGGSPIGLAKAISLALETERSGQPARARFPTDQPLIAVIAIPTTYAGSEMTPIFGVTQMAAGGVRKVTLTDMKVTPKLALYDPELTLDLPPQMTAASGMNALAHAVEAVYSIAGNPLATAAALTSVGHITRALPRTVSNGGDLEARTDLLLGAHLAAVAIATTKIGLHHGLCHVLGGTAGVPHGIANGVILPHAMRYNGDLVMAELAAVARAMGFAGDDEAALAERAAQAVFNLAAIVGLPQRLRDVGVAESDLPHLAELALKSTAVQNNPKPITSSAQTEAVLRAAW